MLIPRHSGYSADGRRVLFKGGGGDAGAAARQDEAARQGRIQAATDEINRIFNGQQKVQRTRTVAARKIPGMLGGDFVEPERQETYEEWITPNGGGREPLYADQRKNIYDLNSQEVNRQAVEAERANRFGLARTGLAGGSVDVDAGTEINRRTNEGLLRAGGIADQSAADLRTADEQARGNLISMAQSGIDTGSAASMALNGLKNNAANAAAQRSGASIGSLFGDMSQAYLMNQQQKGMAAGAQLPGQQWFAVSNPRQGSSGTVQS